MHNPIINTLNQHVRFRSMTLRRVLRNRRISTLSLYVSNTLMLVYKGDIKTKRGKCISMVVFRMGILCAACHVCRSGIRVNWTNPHLKIKITSPPIWTIQSLETSVAQLHTFFFQRRVGGWYRSEFAFRMVFSRRLATKVSRGSTHKHSRKLGKLKL